MVTVAALGAAHLCTFQPATWGAFAAHLRSGRLRVAIAVGGGAMLVARFMANHCFYISFCSFPKGKSFNLPEAFF